MCFELEESLARNVIGSFFERVWDEMRPLLSSFLCVLFSLFEL